MRFHFIFFIFFLNLLVNTPFAATHSDVSVLADYSNIESSMDTDPHQSGYAVVIYKREDGFLFGDFTYATGATEGVGARLTDLVVDGAYVSFKAKISAAFDVGNARATRELFVFKGKITGDSLVGMLTVWDGFDMRKPKNERQIKLKRKKIAMPLSYEMHQAIFSEDAW